MLTDSSTLCLLFALEHPPEQVDDTQWLTLGCSVLGLGSPDL